MAGAKYSLTPQDVEKVETRHRRIRTKIPWPGSLDALKKLHRYEPVSMTGQPPVCWERADGLHVYDGAGNQWLDWSSGVLVASAGHSRAEIVDAIVAQAKRGLLHNYCFPSAIRQRLAQRLVELAPDGLDKTFLLTTGSETTECAIKLARTAGRQVGGDGKHVLVTFEGAFHGRTLGAQLAGGIPGLKEWITVGREGFVQVPFPGDWRCEDPSFEAFEKSLADQGVGPDDVCGVMSETYQGGNASFLPVEFAKKLSAWCGEHDAVLILDEVQAGFGRTGTMFGFEHYGLVPDLACFGKGISSSLPISAVLGREDLMDLYPPGSMTSTHTGNPVCCAAALANLDLVTGEDLPANAAAMGEVLQGKLREVRAKYSDVCGAVSGAGLVAGVYIVKPGTKEPDGDLAAEIVERCMQKGLLMFSPVGLGGGLLKIAPPLSSTEDAIVEGCEVLDGAIGDVLASA